MNSKVLITYAHYIGCYILIGSFKIELYVLLFTK